MAELVVQKISLGLASGSYAGITPTYAAAAVGGDTFLNRDNRTFLHVKNDDDASITVTIDSKIKCNQGHEHDVVVTVAATSERIIGPFDPNEFSDGSTDLVSVAYSAVTDVTVGVFSIGEDGRA